MFAALPAGDGAVVVAIVAARLLVPLLIPRCPLLIVAALILDGIDNSLLDRFTEVDLSSDGPYQSWDKALDIYYLAIAYLSTLRNWTSTTAVKVGRFLFYYRLVGIVLFELLASRTMLLVFPNTFEFFFIAYELARLRYRPTRWPPALWVGIAAGLWVFVKLPQEYWIHVAQRDFSDTVAETPAVGVGAALVVAALAAVLALVLRPRLPPPDWGWRLAAEPLPASLDEAHERRARVRERGHPDWAELAEKIAVLALLCTIFAEILPGVAADPVQVTLGVALIVFANAGISTLQAHGHAGIDRAVAAFAALLATNSGLVVLASALLTGRADFQLGAGLFFGFLVTLIVWLYDVYEPVHELRFERS